MSTNVLSKKYWDAGLSHMPHDRQINVCVDLHKYKLTGLENSRMELLATCISDTAQYKYHFTSYVK